MFISIKQFIRFRFFLWKAKRIVKQHRDEYRCHYTMFGGGGGTSTSNSVTQPWSGQEPALSEQYQAAQNLYNTPSDYPQYYPTSTVSPFNDQETSAISQLGNLGSGTSATNSDQNFQNYALNGGLLSNTNPYFQQEAKQITSQVQPQLTASFNAGNNMNNPGAAYAVSNGLGTALGNLAGQNYENALTTTGQIADFGAPSLYGAQQQGAQSSLTAGETAQQQAQNQLDYLVNQYNYNQTLPYNMLDQYASEISGNPGSATSLTQPYYSNTPANLLSAGTGLLAANSLTAGIGSGTGFGSTALGSLWAAL